jgi:hypothetical protein
VHPQHDFKGYIVSAKAQAISTDGDAMSMFGYLMKHPLQNSKIMLSNLDKLVAETSRHRAGFYVIEIKEKLSTT